MLEDLSPAGYVTADRAKGLDFDHCIAVLQTLGRFHALSFAMKDQDPEGFETVANCVKVCDLKRLKNQEYVLELTNYLHYILLFSDMTSVLFNSVTLKDCYCHWSPEQITIISNTIRNIIIIIVIVVISLVHFIVQPLLMFRGCVVFHSHCHISLITTFSTCFNQHYDHHQVLS